MSSANNPPYGAEVAFYCVRPDTAPDLVDIEARAAKGSAMTFFAIYERSSWFSRTVLRLVSPARIVARHRRTYLGAWCNQRFDNAITASSGVFHCLSWFISSLYFRSDE